jgi:hypothetical protein
MQCDIGECDNSQVGDYLAFSIGIPPFHIPSQPDFTQDSDADQNASRYASFTYDTGRWYTGLG